MRKKDELTCCPYCGCEEYYYIERYKGNCNSYHGFGDVEVENTDMYATAEHTLVSVYAYCSECDRKIFKIPLEERY